MMWTHCRLSAGSIFSAAALMSLLAFSPGCRKESASAPAIEKPNILLITIDTLRADRIGCYGYAKASTPSMDAMAAAGVRFERCYAHNVVTLPSHANILTGTYPLSHGIRDNTGYRLPRDIPTAAGLLKDRGYSTAAFVGAFPVDSRFGLDRGFDLYDDSYGDATGAADFRFVERRAEEVVSRFLEWRARDGRESGPWFAWVHLYDPHSPYDPPEPQKSVFAGREYDGEIAYADSQVGRMLGHIRDSKLSETTFVLLTADHGEGLGDHGEATHGIFAYEATLRTPLLITGPGVQPLSVKTSVRHVDLLPTLLDLAGITIPGSLNGRSLRPLLSGSGDQRAAEDIYFEALTASLNRGWAPLQGVISGNQKFIDLPVPELYDIATDPQESRNLASADVSAVSDLRAKLDPLRAGDVGSGTRQQEDAATIEKLRSLGYTASSTDQRKQRYTERDDPKNLIEIDNLLNDGVVAAGRGELARAETIFQKIIAARPTMAIAYSHLAYVYREMGQAGRAVATIQAGVKVGVETPELNARLGMFLDEAGRSDEAITVLEAADRASDGDIDTLTYLGMAYEHAGRPQDAIRTFGRILEIDPMNASAHANSGTVHLGQKNYPAAFASFEQALKLDPKLPSAYNGLGVANASTGNMEAAIANWRRAIELDPHQYDTIFNIAVVYMRMGRAAEARPYVELFVRTAPPGRYGRDIERFRALLRQ